MSPSAPGANSALTSALKELSKLRRPHKMVMKEDPLNVIITGVGGQGNILASAILASTAVQDGLNVSVGETYGASQRGGAVTSHIRLYEKDQCGPLIPEGRAHLILGFEPVECLRSLGVFGNQNTNVIVNPKPIYPVDVLSGEATYPNVEEVLRAIKELVDKVYVVEAAKIAMEAENVVLQNIVMAGCLIGSEFTPLTVESAKDVITEVFANKTEAYLKAFELGVQEIRKTEPL
jgi:indolepyruvate ferredoxin oxidoreductase beta subunit